MSKNRKNRISAPPASTTAGGREADARVRIESLLANAGWRGDQIEREGARFPEQQRALRSGRPDFLLYAPDLRRPMAVVEAKKSGGNLRAALRQGLGYAEALECGVVFASDGNIVASAHAKAAGRPLMMNDAEVSAFLPEKHLRHFQESRSWDRGAGFAARSDLVRLFNSARRQLNREGIARVEAFNEFAKLVFVKILTELRDDGGEMFQDIPASWGDIAGLAGSALMREYERVLLALNERYEGGFDATKIRSPKILEALIGLVTARSFIDTDADVKGGAYEYFLRDYTRTRDELNRYFTPRHIVRMMVNLANPQNGERVYDPFCGTGGMLIESFRHMWRRLPPEGAARRRALSRLRQHSLYGRDISEAAHVAKMNMILSGDGHSNIQRGDSAACDETGRYDVVLTNIPFSMDGEARFVRCCLNAVRGRENGRAAIVVPERIVCEEQYARLRAEILAEWRVERVVSLPRDVFAEYTNAKTSVLFVSWRGRGAPQKSVPVFKIAHDGFKGKTRRKPDPDAPNDISEMFLGQLAPRESKLTAPFFFFNRAGAAAIRPRGNHPVVKVGDVISHVRRPLEISAGMLCLEPGFEAKEHRIFVRERKRPNQVAVRRRFAIRRGDLVIGLLHTQNGLIAFSDSEEEMHATATHAAFTVDEGRADRRYLFWTLRGILMTMERVDVVGREQFKVAEILALPFPLPPLAEQRKIGKAMDAAREKIRKAEAALEKSRADFAETERRLRTFEAD